MSTTIQLDAKSWIDYYPNFLIKEEADTLYSYLDTQIPWRTVIRETKRGQHELPRLQCWMSDSGVKAKLFQKEPALSWSPEVDKIRKQLESSLKAQFDYVLMNLYRDGKDQIWFHADDEAVSETKFHPPGTTGLFLEEEGKNVIASISLGVTRKFLVRHKTDSPQKYDFDLPHGSLIVMRGDMQKNWLHSVPGSDTITPGHFGSSKSDTITSKRINLTFRKS